MRQPVRELLETVFAFHRPAALGALVCLAACSPPPRPIAARASVPAPAAAPVIPPFAAHAPAHTRLLLSVRLDPQGANSPLDSLAPLFGNCDFALRRDVERIDVALAEPKEFRLDLSGGVSLEAIRCVLGALEERGALGGVELEAVALPRGVRIATHAALADVDGAPTPLAKRLAELLAHAESAGVADLAPGGSYEFWFEHGALSLRTGLHSPDEATRAALWLKRAFGAEPSGRLETFEVAAEGGTLNVRAPNLAVDEALLLRRNVLEAFRIPSASMLPTLLPGDLLFALKGPAAHTAARGDLVVFTSSRDPPQDFVKRVIGVGGDHVELDGYGVRINGTPLVTKLETADFVAQGDDTVRGELWSESVGGHSYRVLHDASHAWRDKVDTTVEPDHVFLLGDNRDNSMDSRQFGSVPLTALKGRVALIWASFDDQGVRWDRFGTEPE